MKQYNRALDYTVLALAELQKGNAVVAAKLMAAAASQKDVTAAIRILEASNKQAFVGAQAAKTTTASKRLKANEEFPFEDGDVEAGEEDMDMDTDPLDEIESAEEEMVEDEMVMEDEEPGVAMAKVLSKMVKRSGRK
jgi:hypothetical protein